MGKNTQSKKAGSGNFLREFSSGGAVFKKINGKFLWLIAATNPSQLYPQIYWRLPKGWIDDAGSGIPGPIASGLVKADEESLQKTAIREVAEEGGVAAEIIKKIGTSKFSYKNLERGNVLKFVTFYLMKWIEDLPDGHDGETSEVVWLPYDEAKKKLSFNSEKEILSKANEILSSLPL